MGGATASYATVPPNIVATYNGTGDEQCLAPLGAIEPFAIQLNITSQNGFFFDGNASLLFAGGFESFAVFNGQVDDQGIISMGVFQGNDSSGTFSGTAAGDTISIQYLGADFLPGCSSFQGSFTVVLDAIGLLTPSNIAQAVALLREGQREIAQAYNAHVTTVLNQLLTQAPAETGVSQLGNGLMFQSGQSAGDGYDYPWGIWGTVQYSEFEDDFFATAFDGERVTVIGGVDVSPWNNVVFGVALAYEDADTDTTFNGGESEIDGITVLPYMGALLPDFGLNFDLTFDMGIGYGSLEIDQFRTVAGTRITSKVDVDRHFVISHLNGFKEFGNFLVSGRVGVIIARDDHEGFTESDGTVVADRQFDLGQFRIGGDVAYSWGSFEPFVSALYEYDYNHEDLVVVGPLQAPNDSDDVALGLGLRWYGDNNLTASLEYNTIIGREDFDSDSIQFFLRADF